MKRMKMIQNNFHTYALIFESMLLFEIPVPEGTLTAIFDIVNIVDFKLALNPILKFCQIKELILYPLRIWNV